MTNETQTTSTDPFKKIDDLLGNCAPQEDAVFTTEQIEALNKEIDPGLHEERTMENGEVRKFVPAYLRDYIADRIFGPGNWNIEIESEEIIFNGETPTLKRGKDGKLEPIENTIHRVIAKASVRVTVHGKNGKTVTRSAIGLGIHDVQKYSPEVKTALQIALKGAVTDARITALRLFGRIFGLCDAEKYVQEEKQRAASEINASIEKSNEEHKERTARTKNAPHNTVNPSQLKGEAPSKSLTVKSSRSEDSVENNPNYETLVCDANGLSIGQADCGETLLQMIADQLEGVSQTQAIDSLKLVNAQTARNLAKLTRQKDLLEKYEQLFAHAYENALVGKRKSPKPQETAELTSQALHVEVDENQEGEAPKQVDVDTSQNSPQAVEAERNLVESFTPEAAATEPVLTRQIKAAKKKSSEKKPAKKSIFSNRVTPRNYTPSPVRSGPANPQVAPAKKSGLRNLQCGLTIALNEDGKPSSPIAFGQDLKEAVKNATSSQQLTAITEDVKPFMASLKATTTAFFKKQMSEKLRELKAAEEKARIKRG